MPWHRYLAVGQTRLQLFYFLLITIYLVLPVKELFKDQVILKLA